MSAIPENTLARRLTRMDAVMLLVGGVIGSGIFLTAGQVSQSVKRADLFILAWVVGGVISLLACLSVAELAGMYPHAGGQYVYLREAYGELPAFLYGWMIFAVVQTGTIAALAVGFAQYFAAAFPALKSATPLIAFAVPGTKDGFHLLSEDVLAIVAIAVFTAVNIFGVKIGAWVVNVSTWIKFGVMAAFIVLGLAIGHGDWGHFATASSTVPVATGQMVAGFATALIGV